MTDGTGNFRTVGELIAGNLVYELDGGRLNGLRQMMLDVAEWLKDVPLPPDPDHDDVDIQATEYQVSILPRDDINRSIWSVNVAYRGNDRYAVLMRGSWCLSRSGTWDHEYIPSERTDEWKAERRFELEEALRLAVEHAPNVRCNGKTAVELLEWLRERDAAGSQVDTR